MAPPQAATATLERTASLHGSLVDGRGLLVDGGGLLIDGLSLSARMALVGKASVIAHRRPRTVASTDPRTRPEDVSQSGRVLAVRHVAFIIACSDMRCGDGRLKLILAVLVPWCLRLVARSDMGSSRHLVRHTRRMLGIGRRLHAIGTIGFPAIVPNS